MGQLDNEIITLKASDGVSTFSIVPALGGMGVSLKLPFEGAAQELLYLPEDFWTLENKLWQGGWPYCFPVCGRLACQTMPMHGFAPDLPWQVAQQSTDSITLVLRESPDTLAQYPYAFEVSLTYTLKPGELHCLQSISNLGDEPMPYYAGFHPYFLTPMDQKDQILVNFESVKRKQYNADLTDIIGDLPPLSLPKPITDPSLNEQLSELSTNITELQYPNGMVISMLVNGLAGKSAFPYVQLYTQPDKPFFCIEPWMNFPNALNHKNELSNLNPKETGKAQLLLKIDRKLGVS